MAKLGSRSQETSIPDHDVLVVGAGIGGLYQLYRLLDAGLDARILEATDGLGGTWHRNRYPGCRFDSESYSYAYSFSKELLEEWHWSEMFAPQPETLRYLNHVADKFNLRDHIDLNSKVVSAVFDEDDTRWTVTLQDGRQLRSRFVVTAIGVLSVPSVPKFEGRENFEGRAFHTIEWPEDLDLTGKKVGVIGTGSSGVQVITEIADQVEELTVFQLDVNWGAPLCNREIDDAEMEGIRASYDEIFNRCRNSPSGFLHIPERRKTLEVPEAERLEFWEKLYNAPGMGIWFGNYMDTLMKEEANAELSRFVADKIRSRVDDPEIAEKLIPKDHGFGMKRVVLETGYYEIYNRTNVQLVDLNETPIERFTATGLETTAQHHDLDVVVFATGFDAFTGPFERIDIVGRNGERLTDHWADGPQTSYGIQVSGFPNLLMIAGPQGASGSVNAPRGLEDIVDWNTGLITHLYEQGYDYVEATPEAQEAWVEHVKDVSTLLLISKAKSWFTGHNVNRPNTGPPRYLIYAGGNIRYREHLEKEAQNGYPGFVLKSTQPATAT